MNITIQSYVIVNLEMYIIQNKTAREVSNLNDKTRLLAEISSSD